MNWDAIGAIAELLGSIGVIASLVCLATQIRQSREQMSQNTRAMQGEAYQQLQQNVRETWNTMLTVPGLDRVVSLGLDDFGQLNEEDAFRFTFWIRGVMQVYDNAYFQHRTGMLAGERWQPLRRDLQDLFKFPGAVQWWRTATPSLNPEFVALVEEILGEESDRADPQQGVDEVDREVVDVGPG